MAWRPPLGELEQALYQGASPDRVWCAIRALIEVGPPPPRPLQGGEMATRWLFPTRPADDHALPSGWNLCRNPAAAASLSEAFDLVTRLSPVYADWIADAVSNVVLLDGADDVRFSATVREAPGLVYMSAPLEPVEIAARLAHEASHQNFFALERLRPLHDGTDTKTYYSPIKRRERPIE